MYIALKEGYGVDAYLYLPILGDACENLPMRVIRSPGNLDSSATAPKQVIRDGDGFADSTEYAGDEKAQARHASRNEDFYFTNSNKLNMGVDDQDNIGRKFHDDRSKRPSLSERVGDRAL